MFPCAEVDSFYLAIETAGKGFIAAGCAEADVEDWGAMLVFVDEFGLRLFGAVNDFVKVDVFVP